MDQLYKEKPTRGGNDDRDNRDSRDNRDNREPREERRGGYRGNRGRGGNRGGDREPRERREPREPKEYGFELDQQVAVKIRGMPYQTRYEEVSDFFREYKFINQSVVLGLNHEGRKNGFGAILFDNEEEAAAAAKGMNNEYIGSRYVDLSVISYDDYKKFNYR